MSCRSGLKSQIIGSPASRTQNICRETEDLAFSGQLQRRNESKRYRNGREHLLAAERETSAKLTARPLDAAMFGLGPLTEASPSPRALDMEFLQDIETMRRLPRFSSSRVDQNRGNDPKSSNVSHCSDGSIITKMTFRPFCPFSNNLFNFFIGSFKYC
jgi:hypothetical protein